MRESRFNMLGYAMGRALGLPVWEAARWAGSKAKSRRGACNSVRGFEEHPDYPALFDKATVMMLRMRVEEHLRDVRCVEKLPRHAEIGVLPWELVPEMPPSPFPPMEPTEGRSEESDEVAA